MNLHSLTTTVEPWLGEALETFERQFTYPLGANHRFNISHGAAYLPFFQAMGDPTILVAEEAGEVMGTLARVQRRVQCQLDGLATAPRLAHYLCDLKVRPAARGSRVLAYLLQAAKQQIEASHSHTCYAVVMDGTNRLPVAYTGRLGIPPFLKLAEIVILRLSASAPSSSLQSCRVVAETELRNVLQALRSSGCSAATGNSHQRSLMDPLYLITENAQACGTLEDTRKGKRLFEEGGEELVSAHLSSFAYSSPVPGGQLLRDAVALAKSLDMPAVFAAVPASEAARLLPHLCELEVLQAPATVYGHDLEPGLDWWIDTSEI